MNSMDGSKGDREHSEDWRILMGQAVLCGVLLLVAIAIEKLTEASSSVIVGNYFLAMLVGGWDTAVDALRALRKKKIDIHFLMLTVAVGAAVIGAWQEGALLLFLFALGGALEHFAIHRMNREISALSHAAPKTARVVLEDGSVEEREVEQLVIGDRLQVRPDEIFPVDAVVLSGKTEVDESTLTGEALPVSKDEGDELSSGTLNLWGLVTVEVLRPVEESSLSKIIGMIRHAQESKAPSQRFTDRFGSGYAIGVLGAAAIMFTVWWVGFQLEPRAAFYRAMALLVVASPCALVLSIPSAILAGIAWGARHGVLFRGGSAIEGLAEIDVVALDKTGTLTAGQMEVIKVETFPAGREDELMEIAVSVEQESNHPVARAIARYGEEAGLAIREVKNLHSLTGLGIQANVAGENYSLGKRELLDDDSRLSDSSVHSLEHTEVWVVGENLLGRILLQDEIRHESRPVLERLKRDGITTMMLTGDNAGAAAPVAKDLGITEVHAGLRPDDKVGLIYQLIKQGRHVAMVGDGVNDAPSLAAAHVSISMGGRGSDAALEQADVVLVDDRIGKLASALHLSRRSKSVINQNLAISLGTVLVMVAATLIGTVPLVIAVVVHESSTVLVCLNSLRLLFLKDEDLLESASS
ncbi:heavy metal translocating P-type ATPase [Akkermansiaceae bacterium]|nr:heavy metal translocating P-type ATPase [Akkermansiaceae bacterium]